MPHRRAVVWEAGRSGAADEALSPLHSEEEGQAWIVCSLFRLVGLGRRGAIVAATVVGPGARVIRLRGAGVLAGRVWVSGGIGRGIGAARLTPSLSIIASQYDPAPS